MDIEIKPHRWEERGERYGSHFFVFVDGEPRKDLSSCSKCTNYRGEAPCAKLVEVGEDGEDLIYPFCGRICGYFTLKTEEVA